MLNTLRLAAALTLAASAVAAQTPALTDGLKVKTKTKRARREEASTATAPATAAPAATDWSVPYAATITPEGLRQDLSVLASDAYEGRETGQKGQRMAADYLAKAFAADGLVGPVAGADNPYLQHFNLDYTTLDPASTVTVGGRTFRAGRDFYVFLQNAATATGPVQPAFVGYGISTPGYADFTPGAPALHGKALVLLLGEPTGKNGRPLLPRRNGLPSPYGQPGFVEMAARSPAFRSLDAPATFRIAPSAAAFARAPQDYLDLLNRTHIDYPGEAEAPKAGTNIFIVTPEMGAALLGTTVAGLAQYRQAVAAAGKPVPAPFRPAAVTLHVQEKTTPLPTENVLGYLEGGDKKDEVVVLSAHYDHEGIKNGQVYNGADDDGSGTVSILAMARAFAQAKREGHGPRRSLLFLANTGEEKGLLGSRYYTDHPVFPLAGTVTDLNIDMVGRVDSAHAGNGDYVYVIGDDRLSADLHQLSEAANQQYQPLTLDYTYNDPNDPQHLYYRSDHYNFAKNRVPIIFYTSGLHKDYHQPTDDVDKIDFAALARRDQLIFHTAWAVANRDQRPQLNEASRRSYQPTAADLDRYAGTYANPRVPMSLVVAHVGNSLHLQVSGQENAPLEAVSPGVFQFEPAGMTLEFAADKPAFTLKMQGQGIEFTKEK